MEFVGKRNKDMTPAERKAAAQAKRKLLDRNQERDPRYSLPALKVSDPRKAIVVENGGDGILLRVALIRALKGDAEAAILMSQFIYWAGKSTHPQGWFHNKQDALEMQTALSPKQQTRARGVLIAAGYIQEIKSGTPPKIFVRVDLPVVEKAIVANSFRYSQQQLDEADRSVDVAGVEEADENELDQFPPYGEIDSATLQTPPVQFLRDGDIGFSGKGENIYKKITSIDYSLKDSSSAGAESEKSEVAQEAEHPETQNKPKKPRKPRKPNSDKPGEKNPTDHQRLFEMMAKWVAGSTKALTKTQSARVGKITKEALETAGPEIWQAAANHFFADAFWATKKGDLDPTTLLNKLKPLAVKLLETPKAVESPTTPEQDPLSSYEARRIEERALGALQELQELFAEYSDGEDSDRRTLAERVMATANEDWLNLRLRTAYEFLPVWKQVLEIFEGFPLAAWLTERPYGGKMLGRQIG